MPCDRIMLEKNRVLALKGRRLQVECMTGAIWITGAGTPGKESTVVGGGRIEFDSRGIVCVQAFENSILRIRKIRNSGRSAMLTLKSCFLHLYQSIIR